jgi:hypothetical protein
MFQDDPDNIAMKQKDLRPSRGRVISLLFPFNSPDTPPFGEHFSRSAPPWSDMRSPQTVSLPEDSDDAIHKNPLSGPPRVNPSITTCIM